MLRFGFALWSEYKTHAAAGHAPEHPESPEITGKMPADSIDQGLGVQIAGPGDDRLNRLLEIVRCRGANSPNIIRAQGGDNFIQDRECLLPALPFCFGEI